MSDVIRLSRRPFRRDMVPTTLPRSLSFRTGESNLSIVPPRMNSLLPIAGQPNVVSGCSWQWHAPPLFFPAPVAFRPASLAGAPPQRPALDFDSAGETTNRCCGAARAGQDLPKKALGSKKDRKLSKSLLSRARPRTYYVPDK